MLYAAKYLWYADMVACRDLGRSMTGPPRRPADGAAAQQLPRSVNEILKADPCSAEPLSAAEEAIVAAVARTFPSNKAIFDAAHSEPIWQGCATGTMICMPKRWA